MKDQPDPEPKPVDRSALEDYFYEVFPPDLNSNQTLFGGRVMEIADRVACSVCRRHCGWPYVTTAAVDRIRFLSPAYVNETLVFKAAVNRVWGSSMEIGVKIMATDFLGSPYRHIFSAYFTYVILNSEGRPIRATPVVPVTPEQKRRYHEAELRRQDRLKSKG